MARSLGEAEVRVTANVTKMATQIRAAIKAAVKGAAGELRFDIDAKDLRAKIRLALAEALNPAPKIVFDIDANTKTATAKLAVLSAQASKDERKTVHVDVDRGLASVGRLVRGLLGGVGALTKFGGAAVAGGAAVQGLGVLIAGLTAIVGNLAAGLVALPGILAGIGAIAATVKIGLSGVGDALSNAFDPSKAEQFNEAMAKLAPSARDFVTSIRGLGPSFRTLKLDVQQRLFAELGRRVDEVANAHLPSLRTNLGSIASSLNVGAQGALNFLASSSAIGQVDGVLSSTSLLAGSLGRSFKPATEGLLAMVSVGAGQLPLLGSAIESVSARFRDWAVASRDSGEMQQMIDTAKATLSDLGTVAGNVGGVINAMFNAADANGQGFLSGLVAITGQMNEFANSTSGMALLTGVFQTISALAAVFRAALGAILPVLSPIIAGLGQVAQTVSGPLVQAFGTIGTALLPFGQALGQIIALFGPFIAQIVSALLPVITQLGGTLTMLATTLMGALGPVLPVIANAFTQVATAVGPVIAALGSALGPVLAALAPVLGQIAQVLAGVLVQAFNALAPVLPIIGQALSAVVSAFGPLLGVVVQLAGTLLSALLPVLGPIAQILSTVLVQAFQILTPVITALTPIIGQLAGLFAGILLQALNALAPIFPVIAEAVAGILNAFLPLLPVVMQLVQAVLPPLLSIFLALVPAIIPLVQAIGQIATAVIQVIAPVVQFVATLVGQFVGMAASVIAVIVGFVAGVIGFFASLLGGVISIVGSIVGGVLSFFSNLASGVINMVGSFVSGVVGFFGVMLGGVLGAISSLVGGVLGAIGNMISGALGALSGWVGKMVQVGVDVVNGIVNGLRSAASRVIDFLVGLARDALGAVKRFLGIASPSRRFASEVGEQIGNGIVVGQERRRSAVVETARSIAQQAAQAAAGAVQAPVSGATEAARQILARMRAGGRVFEDWTWQGAPEIVGRFNDELLNEFKRSGMRDPIAFLEQRAAARTSSPALRDAGRTAGREIARGITSTTPVVIRAAEVLGRTISTTIGRNVRAPLAASVQDSLGRSLAAQGIVTQPFDVGSLARPTRPDTATAAPVADPDGIADAVRQGMYAAIDGARFTVDGPGVARLVNDQNREQGRR